MGTSTRRSELKEFFIVYLRENSSIQLLHNKINVLLPFIEHTSLTIFCQGNIPIARLFHHDDGELG